MTPLGGFAFPIPPCPLCGTDHAPHTDNGMSMIEWYAGLAMAGMLAGKTSFDPGISVQEMADAISERAFTLAESMLVQTLKRRG